MNDLFVYRTVRRGALSLAIALSLTLAGFGSAAAGNKAAVVVGFLGVPPPGFQNVLLNVVAIRLNPHAGAAPTASGWQKITVPAAIGSGGGAAPELQIDLNDSQNIPELFNTGHVKSGSYRIAQLILDPNNPGTLIPNCAGAGALEGCINYPIQLANAGSPINVTAPKGTPALVSPSKRNLSPLILQLQVKVTNFPVSQGGAYTISVDMTSIPGPNLIFGTITGNVPSGSGSTAKHTRKLAVTAEAIGTNTEIASAPVTPNASGTGGTYTLMLPAANNFGTLYDLAVAGGNDSYGGARLLALLPGQSITQNFTALSTNQPIGSISGRITDDCTGSPITNATIQLLIPPLNNPNLSDGSGDCSVPGNAAQCVSVATTNTDNAGDFPLPGTLTIPSAFDSVPILSNDKTYTMIVSAPGYDSRIALVKAAARGNNDNCSTGSSFVPCKIALTSGYITGTIPITPPPPGQTTMIQVFAEDTGTNNIVSALPMPVMVRSSSGGNPRFTLNVPTEPPGRAFDLFATTIDLYQGVSDPYQGHTIAVLRTLWVRNADGPGRAIPPPSVPASVDKINCVGHGSLTGFVAGADLGTSVGLAKNGVQITNMAVQNIGNDPASNAFAFCVPGGDTYTLQRFQLPLPPVPVPPSPTSVATPTPTAPLVMPTPAPVATRSMCQSRRRQRPVARQQLRPEGPHRRRPRLRRRP